MLLVLAVSYDNARVGHVDKGDVRALFGWNDAELQKNATDLKFTNKQVDALDISWSCANGDTHHTSYSGTATRTLNVAKLTNKAGKVTDWTLNGFDGPAIIKNTDTGPAYDCPIDNPWDWMSSNINSSSTTTNVVQVTYGDISYDLPVTPVAVAWSTAPFAIAAGVSLFELARFMGTSADQIDKTYGHLLPDALDRTRLALDAFTASGHAAEGLGR